MSDTPNFEDLATDVVDVLQARGWSSSGFGDLGFWNVTQLARGSYAVNVYAPSEKDQDRVWLSPAKGGKRATSSALRDLGGAGIEPAARTAKGVRLVRTVRRSRAKKNPPRARRNYPAEQHAQLAGIEEGTAFIYGSMLEADPYNDVIGDKWQAAGTRAQAHAASYKEPFQEAREKALMRRLKAKNSWERARARRNFPREQHRELQALWSEAAQAWGNAAAVASKLGEETGAQLARDRRAEAQGYANANHHAVMDDFEGTRELALEDRESALDTTEYWEGWGAPNPPLLPLASSRARWDAQKARRALRRWATTKGGRVDVRKYARAFLIVDGDPNNLTSYKLPIATVYKDKRGRARLKAVPRAIYAAAGVIDGARGGVDAPRAQIQRARAQVGRYYKKMGKRPPWARPNPPSIARARRNPGTTLTEAARKAPPAIRRKP
jgi:hypothetical protein